MEPSPINNTTDHRLQLAQALMVLGLSTAALALTGALLNHEPFDTWLYAFFWWSYLLFTDGWVYRRRKESLLLSHPSRFLFFAVFSVGLWFLFEAINLRLHNWTYEGLPASQAVRWAGYVLGFATVVPAIMETADLLDTAEFLRDGHIKPLGWKARVGAVSFGAGALCLLLPLLWPSLFFPLAWVAFALLLDPVNERLGAPSLLTDAREGSVKRLRTLLLSGLLCGVLWEAWNVPARARWIYHLPGLDKIKIFEMPLPGYLGFPAFAVEVFVLTSFGLALWERTPRFLKPLCVAALAAFAFFMCGAVDRFTVGSLQP